MVGEIEMEFYTYRFSLWRYYNAKRFLPNICGNLKNQEDVLRKLTQKGRICILSWGLSFEEDFDYQIPNGVILLRLEDGFVRSVGLGIRLIPALSWVIDDLGIYYDSRRPSKIENILNLKSFTHEEIKTADILLEDLIKKKITKYNLREQQWKKPKTIRRVIVVPGQVETDASIKYGSLLKTNFELLTLVREENPKAYIVYKPHPDVVGGYRKGDANFEDIRRLCDEIVVDVSSIDLIENSDEVHVNTSLFGFEALIRGKKVVCYGQPFYCGWGLTEDKHPVERRKRKRSIQELLCASLVDYPTYASVIRRLDVFSAIAELEILKNNPPTLFRLYSLLIKLLNPFLRWRAF